MKAEKAPEDNETSKMTNTDAGTAITEQAEQ